MGWVPDDQSIINHWVDIPNSKNHVRVAHSGKNNQERFKRMLNASQGPRHHDGVRLAGQTSHLRHSG